MIDFQIHDFGFRLLIAKTMFRFLDSEIFYIMIFGNRPVSNSQFRISLFGNHVLFLSFRKFRINFEFSTQIFVWGFWNRFSFLGLIKFQIDSQCSKSPFSNFRNIIDCGFRFWEIMFRYQASEVVVNHSFWSRFWILKMIVRQINRFRVSLLEDCEIWLRNIFNPGTWGVAWLGRMRRKR